MNRIAVLALVALCYATHSRAQTGVGTTASHPSAALDVTSTSQGLLPPRMTWGQIQAIPSPAAGLMVYGYRRENHPPLQRHYLDTNRPAPLAALA